LWAERVTRGGHDTIASDGRCEEMRIHLPATASAPGPASPSPLRPHCSSFSEVLGSRVIDPPPSPLRSPSPVTTASGPSPVRQILGGAIGAERRVDALLAAAARGKTFSPGELLALQSITFRYAQTVEIVSRVADRLVGTIKQTMNTQV
jgi:hypothetical protein